MGDPVFWLAISLLLVCVSLAVAIAMAIPALQELGRAARSAEKLFDTLTRELPPTLEAIRLTGLEISDLTDDMTSGVQQAGQVVQKVDRSFDGARHQVRRAGLISRRTAAGVRAAWRSLTRSNKKRRSPERLPAQGEQYENHRNGEGRYFEAPRSANPTGQSPSPSQSYDYPYDDEGYDNGDYDESLESPYSEESYSEESYSEADGADFRESGDRPNDEPPNPVPPSNALPADTSSPSDIP
ncbi:MAG: DUF948 domain-containing protein [Cyanobacteria bacterium P01_D01_bin.73]